MDTKKMEMLLNAAGVGSLKKTAEMYNYSQAGLIYAINSLEQELEINILHRDSKGVRFTDVGEELEPYIRDVVESAEKMEEKLAEIKRKDSAVLRIGAYPIYACYCLPSIIKDFVAKNPMTELSINVGTQEDLVSWMQDDKIDIAIGEKADIDKSKWYPVMEDETYVAFPVDYPIPENRQKMKIEDVLGYPILYSTYNPASLEVEKLTMEGAKKIIVSSKDGSALLCLVEQGLGITFISSQYFNECPATVRMLPLDPPILRELGIMVKKKKMSQPSAAAFIECCVEYNKSAQEAV